MKHLLSQTQIEIYDLLASQSMISIRSLVYGKQSACQQCFASEKYESTELTTDNLEI